MRMYKRRKKYNKKNNENEIKKVELKCEREMQKFPQFQVSVCVEGPSLEDLNIITFAKQLFFVIVAE